MKRDKRCPSCATRLAGHEKRCPSCGTTIGPKTTPEGDEAPSLDGFVELATDEPERVQGLLDRLVAAGIEFVPVADPGADPWTKGSSGHEAFVSVYVRPAELDRAQAIERQWMREMIPDVPSATSAPEADDWSFLRPTTPASHGEGIFERQTP